MTIPSWTGLALAGAGLIALLGYEWLRRRRLARLYAGSQVVQTSRGPMEYALEGRGPILLCFHGTAGGYDQGLGPGRFLNGLEGNAEFTLLSPSRPGYLRTPLETGRTPEEQADAVAALLDHLGIEQVAVIGISGGGPFALQFALRHPHRLWALVMFCALTHRLPPRKGDRWRARLFSSRVGATLLDLFLGSYLSLMLRFQPRRLARRFFRRMTVQTTTDTEIYRRVEAMLANPVQFLAFRRVVSGMLPLSARTAGIMNDKEQLTHLADYPLEQIRVPTLILQGCEDSGSTPSHAAYLTEKIPEAEVYSIERCGHLIWVGDHVLHMRSTVMEFLRRHAPSKDTEIASAGETVASTECFARNREESAHP